MGIENKVGDCKHIVVVYLGRQKLELSEGYMDLANCKRCHTTISLDESYKEISKNIYVRIRNDK